MNQDSRVKPKLEWTIKHCNHCKKQTSFFRDVCTHCQRKVGFEDLMSFLKNPKKMYNG